MGIPNWLRTAVNVVNWVVHHIQPIVHVVQSIFGSHPSTPAAQPKPAAGNPAQPQQAATTPSPAPDISQTQGNGTQSAPDVSSSSQPNQMGVPVDVLTMFGDPHAQQIMHLLNYHPGIVDAVQRVTSTLTAAFNLLLANGSGLTEDQLQSLLDYHSSTKGGPNDPVIPPIIPPPGPAQQGRSGGNSGNNPADPQNVPLQGKIEDSEGFKRLMAENKDFCGAASYYQITYDPRYKVCHLYDDLARHEPGTELTASVLQDNMQRVLGYKISTQDPTSGKFIDPSKDAQATLNLLDANLQIISKFDSIKDKAGWTHSGVDVFRKVFATNNGQEITVYLGADDSNAGTTPLSSAKDARVGFTPSDKDGSPYSTSIYLGSDMTPESIIHEYGHQFNRYFDNAPKKEMHSRGFNYNALTGIAQNPDNPNTKLDQDTETIADLVMTGVLSGDTQSHDAPRYAHPDKDKTIKWSKGFEKVGQNFENYMENMISDAMSQ